MTNLMDFKDQIKQLGDRVELLKDQIATEEATKNAFIMPFIRALGYDVFNPLEVVPEFTADVGVKKGEKVDYAIMRDSLPSIIIECKHWAQKLDLHDNQLMRYFNVSKAKFAILTNGIKYRFYTDLVEPNIMDDKPFLEFDITDIKDTQIEELKKFHTSYFDVNNILSSASDMKYTTELKALIHGELRSPSEDFIRYFTKKVYPKTVTANVLFQFSELVKKSAHQVVSDMINDRLKSAIGQEDSAINFSASANNEPIIVAEETLPENNDKQIITTEEELESYYIVKSILRTIVDSNRIVHRDTLSYFGILLDDNKNRLICRVYLNNPKRKQIGILDSAKKETKFDIASIDEIYNFADQLKATVETYLAMAGGKANKNNAE